MKFLKDVVLNISSDCPPEYLHSAGTEGIICDKEGFKYIVSQPLLAATLKLYDLNIRTVSSGSNGLSEIGISCDWDSLDDQNKKAVEKYLLRKGTKLDTPCPHAPETRFRIGIEVSEDETVENAEQKMLKEVDSIGLVKQDVLFGKLSIEDAQKEYSYGLDLMPEKALQNAVEMGGVVVDETIWVSKELYSKHQDFLKEKETEQQLSEHIL